MSQCSSLEEKVPCNRQLSPVSIADVFDVYTASFRIQNKYWGFILFRRQG